MKESEECIRGSAEFLERFRKSSSRRCVVLTPVPVEVGQAVSFAMVPFERMEVESLRLWRLNLGALIGNSGRFRFAFSPSRHITHFTVFLIAAPFIDVSGTSSTTGGYSPKSMKGLRLF